MKKGLLLFMMLFSGLLSAQELAHESIEWDSVPVPTKLSAEQKEHAAVIVHSVKCLEWAKSSEWQGSELKESFEFLFTTMHRRVKVNNDEGVESYNTMYLGVTSNEELLSFKARSIQKDGKVVNFDKENMKYIENFEGYGPYYILAFEGVELGSEIEYLYTVKSSKAYNYGTHYLQSEYPVLNAELHLWAPQEYVFESKLYNRSDSVKLDRNSKSHYYFKSSIPAFQQEDFSADDALLQRIEFNIVDKGGDYENLGSWELVANHYVSLYYNTYGHDPLMLKKEKKAIKKLLNELDLKSLSKEEKVIQLEAYLKKEYSIVDDGSYYIHEIVKSKKYTNQSAFRMSLLLLTELDVEHQLVYTSNRYERAFDPNFESMAFLNEYFIYLPKFKEYYCPSCELQRYGSLPYAYIDQEALHVKTLSIGGRYTAFPYSQKVPGEDFLHNRDDLYITAELASDFTTLNVDVVNRQLGHPAEVLQPYIPFLTEEEKKNRVTNIFNPISKGVKLKSYTLGNIDVLAYKYAKDKMFEIKAKLEVNDLVQKAGPKYIIELGKLIGEQAELYQEKERVHPVVSAYNRQYIREIKFKIPEGYKVSNLSELQMMVVDTAGEASLLGFLCQAKVDGDELIIKVREYYKDITAPKSEYDIHRKVINAAADFNKKAVVLKRAN